MRCTTTFNPQQRAAHEFVGYPFCYFHPPIRGTMLRGEKKSNKFFIATMDGSIGVVAFIFLGRRSLLHNPAVTATTAVAVTPIRSPWKLIILDTRIRRNTA